MAKRQSQSAHDNMVKYAAECLIANNYQNVKADIDGYTSPEKKTWTATGKGHVPDVTGVLNQIENIFEVETADSINEQHSEDQWKLFAAFAEQHNAIFWVAVPNNSTTAAQQRLNTLGISAKVWGI